MIISETYNTSSTGGTGNLTLSNTTIHESHGPRYTDYWGTGAPDPWIDYTIIQFANTAPNLSIVQIEQGIAQLNTGFILERSNGNVFQTYTQSSGITPSLVNPSNPTQLNFSACANNILITTTPYAGGIQQLPRFRNTTNFGVTNLADGLGDPSAHLGMLSGTYLTVTANTLYYSPFLVSKPKNYTKATLYIQTASAAGIARFGLYHDNGTGWPGQLIVDWGNTATFSTATTGLKTVTLASSIYLSPGWYWGAFICTKTPIIGVGHIRMINPGGTTQGCTFSAAKQTSTWGILSQTGLASSGFFMESDNEAIVVLIQ